MNICMFEFMFVNVCMCVCMYVCTNVRARCCLILIPLSREGAGFPQDDVAQRAEPVFLRWLLLSCAEEQGL